MTEHPILFQTTMVQAIERTIDPKTQTRRIIPHQPYLETDHGLWHCYYPWGDGGHGMYKTETEMREEFDRLWLAHCRYGQSGDVLWVREAWTWVPDSYKYRAVSVLEWTEELINQGKTEADLYKWKPSIHMSRKAARLFLEVLKVRVERIADISEADAIAEGVTYLPPDEMRSDSRFIREASRIGISIDEYVERFSAKNAFRNLWNQINGRPKPIYKKVDGKKVVDHYVSYPFDGQSRREEYRGKQHHIIANPWVWVIDFKKMEFLTN